MDRELPRAVEALTRACTDDGVFIVGPDYRIVYWDPKAGFLTGLFESETVGRPLYEVLEGEREDGTPFCRHGCAVMSLARAGRPVPAQEVQLRFASIRERADGWG